MSDDKKPTAAEKVGGVKTRIMKFGMFQLEGGAESYARRVTTYNEAALVSTALDKFEADPDRIRGKANAERMRENSSVPNNDRHAKKMERRELFLKLDAALDDRKPDLTASARRKILAEKIGVKAGTLKKYAHRS